MVSWERGKVSTILFVKLTVYKTQGVKNSQNFMLIQKQNL